MGKYEPLATYLEKRDADNWTASFAEIEAVLGASLPESAYKYREWWANQRGGGHSQAKGWQDAGWQVWRVDFDHRNVEFRRIRTRPPGSPAHGDEALLERAAEYLGLDDRDQIVREALKALCEREAARRLARLGGTIADLEAPPRRRYA